MRVTKTQVIEELTYTTKQIGLNSLSIPFLTALLYLMASWNPISSDAVVGIMIISLSIIIPIFFGGPVVKEKLLGIHEVLLALPLKPSQLVLIRTLGSFLAGIIGIAVGSVAGWWLTEYMGNPVPLTKISIGILVSAPLLFSFTLLVILITLLFQSTKLDVAKIIIFFIAFFTPMYVPKYLGVGISMGTALLLSLLLSTGALIASFFIIRSLGDELGEKMVLI